MLVAEPLEAGDLKGTRYTLQYKGEIFPVHSHTEDDIHISIIVSGKFKCYGRPEINGEILTPPMVIDWQPNEAHGFIAEEDNSVMVNIQKKKSSRDK